MGLIDPDLYYDDENNPVEDAINFMQEFQNSITASSLDDLPITVNAMGLPTVKIHGKWKVELVKLQSETVETSCVYIQIIPACASYAASSSWPSGEAPLATYPSDDEDTLFDLALSTNITPINADDCQYNFLLLGMKFDEVFPTAS